MHFCTIAGIRRRNRLAGGRPPARTGRAGRLEQTRFVRELLAFNARALFGSQAVAGPGINLIEGFDQPWKRRLEGAMGGYWGMFDADGRPRVTLRGVVVGDPQWWRVPLGMVIGSVAGWLWARGHGTACSAAGEVALRRRLLTCSAMGVAGAGIVALALLQWQMLLEWSRSPLDWALGVSAATTAGLCALAAAGRLARILIGTSSPGSRPGVLAALRTASAREHRHWRWHKWCCSAALY